MAKTEIKIDKDTCKSCELCINVCKPGVLAIDPAVINRKGYSPVSVIYPEKCVGCGNCSLMCPDSAICIIKV